MRRFYLWQSTQFCLISMRICPSSLGTADQKTHIIQLRTQQTRQKLKHGYEQRFTTYVFASITRDQYCNHFLAGSIASCRRRYQTTEIQVTQGNDRGKITSHVLSIRRNNSSIQGNYDTRYFRKRVSVHSGVLCLGLVLNADNSGTPQITYFCCI